MALIRRAELPLNQMVPNDWEGRARTQPKFSMTCGGGGGSSSSSSSSRRRRSRTGGRGRVRREERKGEEGGRGGSIF